MRIFENKRNIGNRAAVLLSSISLFLFLIFSTISNRPRFSIIVKWNWRWFHQRNNVLVELCGHNWHYSFRMCVYRKRNAFDIHHRAVTWMLLLEWLGDRDLSISGKSYMATKKLNKTIIKWGLIGCVYVFV